MPNNTTTSISPGGVVVVFEKAWGKGFTLQEAFERAEANAKLRGHELSVDEAAQVQVIPYGGSIETVDVDAVGNVHWCSEVELDPPPRAWTIISTCGLLRAQLNLGVEWVAPQ